MELLASQLDKNSLGFYVLDKVAVALLLLLAGGMLKVVLERLRTNLTFRSEMAKQRVAYIGEVWSECNRLEADSAQFITGEVKRRWSPDRSSIQSHPERALSTANEIAQQLEAVRKSAVSSRFWLGETLYGHFLSFHKLNIDRLGHFKTCLEAPTEYDAKVAIAKLQGVDEEIHRARQSIEIYVKNPL